jgi:hypothetical protein
MKPDSSTTEQRKPQPGELGDEHPDIQDTALSYIKKLREADPIRYERPKVTVIDKRG